jgi:hypothetical protein
MANNPNLSEVSKATQFKPGQSGNPKGKPVGSRHISTHIQDMLNDPNFELKLKDGSIIKGAPMGAIIKTAIAKAVSGDTRAFDILAKRGWGDKIDITSQGESIAPIVRIIDERQDT